MKINFVGNKFSGSYVYRCLNPINYSNHDCKGDIDPRSEQAVPQPDIKDADMAIFHKANDNGRLQMMRLLKEKGAIVGYDGDDTFHYQDSHKAATQRWSKCHLNLLKEADFVTTSTLLLAKEFSEYNDNVHLVPNLIDFNSYPEPKEPRDKDVNRILLTGSVLWCNDSFNFTDVLKRLDAREDIQLVIFGNYEDLETLPNAEYHEFVNPIDYPYKLKDLNIDLCIIPRENNYFNKCKSNCKYLEMSALKIPTVAQSFPGKDSPYDLTEAEGAPIVLARGDWEKKIEHALRQKRSLGEAAYDWVRKHYNADKNIFDEVINKIDIKREEKKEITRAEIKGDVKVYTAVIGDRDDFRNDILCFSEYNKFQKPVMNAKIYKILSHLYIDSKYSVWVDGNIELLINPKRLAEEWLHDNADIAVWNHFARTCAYEEAGAVKDKELSLPEVVDEQMQRYYNEGFPENYGMGECNVIVRKHNKRTREFNEMWWAEICRHSHRDQLSFPYVMWKTKTKVNLISGNPRYHPYFKYTKHKNVHQI